jgi:hypothetical protein
VKDSDDIQTMFREYVLDQAVEAGKFAASRKPEYRTMYNRDAKGTVALINRLESLTGGVKPVEAGLPTEWFPELRAAGATPGADDGVGLPESWFHELAARPQDKREHQRSRILAAND